MESMVANLSMESDQAENENIDKNMTDADNAKAPNTQVLELSLGETEYVRIPLTDDRRLELMQYSDRHYKGGIFSTIWDGGLGLLRYISDIYGHDWKHVTILDIGSGTGLVGLGAAVASQGKAVVAVTDLMQAMPLLYANIDLNQSNWPPGEGTHSPESGVMEWGKPISRLWLRQLLDRGSISTRGEERTVVITGADVVYRKSLFEPLLATLCELPTRVREFTEKEFTKLECLLAVQSIRSHLDHFWKTARKNGFSVERIAIVDLDKDDKSQIANARVQLLDTQHRQLPPVTQTNKCEGVIWIVRVKKIPYTFTI